MIWASTFEFELNLKYNSILREQSQIILNKLAKKFIRETQAMKSEDGFGFAYDYDFNNFWDEICVDAQGEWTFYHEEYTNVIELFACDAINELTELEKVILWTQTDDFDEQVKYLEYEYESNNLL